MSRTSFLQDLLSTLFERSAARTASDDLRSMEELCAALISERGEASGFSIATAILDRYEKAPRQEKADFFRLLTEAHDLDAGAMQALERRVRLRGKLPPRGEGAVHIGEDAGDIAQRIIRELVQGQRNTSLGDEGRGFRRVRSGRSGGRGEHAAGAKESVLNPF